MKPSSVLLLLLMQVLLSLEQEVRTKKDAGVGMPREHGRSFVLLKRRQSLDQSEHVLSDFKASGRTFYRINTDDFEGVGSGLCNDVHSEEYGQFNSDMSGCSDMESRRCTKPSDCSGCLGLYSCKAPTYRCQLKGLSHSPSGWIH